MSFRPSTLYSSVLHVIMSVFAYLSSPLRFLHQRPLLAAAAVIGVTGAAVFGYRWYYSGNPTNDRSIDRFAAADEAPREDLSLQGLQDVRAQPPEPPVSPPEPPGSPPGPPGSPPEPPGSPPGPSAGPPEPPGSPPGPSAGPPPGPPAGSSAGPPEPPGSPAGPSAPPAGPRPSLHPRPQLTVQHLDFLKVLGKGAYGTVLLAELKGQGRYLAVKALSKQKVLEGGRVESTMVEKRVLALARENPFLTHLFSTFQTHDHLFFVMEFLNGGSLMFHIEEKGPFDLIRSTFYSAEILIGLQFLHEKAVLHRDLKLENVLLDREGHVKIIDFGLCKEDTFGTDSCGTLPYMAPEFFLYRRYTFPVDWWAFGVLVYEMMTADMPFPGNNMGEIFESIITVDLPRYPGSFSMHTRDLLEKLFERDPSRRLGVAGNIRAHPFFQNLYWPALERRELEPPFRPKVKAAHDCSYFDQEVLREEPRLPSVGTVTDQNSFPGFSYISPQMEQLLGEDSESEPCPVVIVPSHDQSNSVAPSSAQHCSVAMNVVAGMSPWQLVGDSVLGLGKVGVAMVLAFLISRSCLGSWVGR